MSDPYGILGVNRNSTDEEIKAAYRALAIQYSPDSYDGNPLSDVAAKKMDEINKAYDSIMSERRLDARSVSSDGKNNSYSSGSSYSGTGQYAEIRQLVNNNRIAEAESRLLAIEPSSRNAEWNFLMGSVCYAKGWLDEADRYYSAAVSMDPQNGEYQAAHDRILNRQNGNYSSGNPYTRGYDTSRTGSCSGCDICSSLICADCCCECMGGDLIPCC